jgi:hypothetical protein
MSVQDAPRPQGAQETQQQNGLWRTAATLFAAVIAVAVSVIFFVVVARILPKSGAEGFVGVPPAAAPTPAGAAAPTPAGAAAPTPAGAVAPVQAAAARAQSRHAALRILDISEAEALNGPSNLLAAVVRRSPNAFNGTAPSTQIADIDSDFALVGAFKESLTSNRPLAPNTITGGGSGLGDIRADPRFEPVGGRVASGDASPSHGGHAGGVTLGGCGSSKFQRTGWSSSYVHGFGT